MMMRHTGLGQHPQIIRNDKNPEETEETKKEEKEYRPKLTLGGVLLGLGRFIIVCILVTIVIVLLTRVVVVGSEVGLPGFIDFSVGLFTGHYSLLSPADVLALRGSLETILFFEFLGLLLVGLYVITIPAPSYGGRGLARTTRRLNDIPPKYVRRQVTHAYGRVIVLAVAIFIGLALLFKLI